MLDIDRLIEAALLEGTQQKIIGQETKYKGTEHKYLIGSRLKIIGVMKGAAKAGTQVDRETLEDDASIALAGGVTADDRVEVAPWIEKDKRWSFVHSDPKAIDLTFPVTKR